MKWSCLRGTALCALACMPGIAGAKSEAEAISLSGAWALYPMAVRWGEEFRKIHPQVRVDISAGGAGKGLTDALAGAVDIGMVSREVSPAEIEKGAFPLAVTLDAVVPVVNARNPLLHVLREKGATRETLASLWIGRGASTSTWGRVVGTNERIPVRVYTRSDACGAAETWAKYLGGRQEDLRGTGIYGDPGLAEAVRRDVAGIGYNNIGFAYDGKTGRPLDGLAILPLDIDGDGRVDPAEDIYATRDKLMKAIAEGRYPSPPARDLYFVTRGRPARPIVRAFLRWVLTDGQKFVAEAGFVALKADQLETAVRRLAGD